MTKRLRVLIVEDSTERQKILINLFKDHAWLVVHTSARAIRLLTSYKFDLITLDYDLAGPGKGEEIASYLSKTKNAETKVFIHSMNAPGAQRIKKHLPDATLIPISKMIKNNATFKRLRQELQSGVNVNWAYVFGGKGQ